MATSFIFGDYDWPFLCSPRLPWGKKQPPPPLFRKDEPIPLLVAFAMGAQHCLAMVGGIITVPLIISGTYFGNFTADQSSYIISAALIVSGIASLIQVTQIPVPFTKYVIGSGLLSVVGISFTFLPIAETAIQTMRSCACDGVPCITGFTCSTCTGKLTGNCLSGQDAYGKILGTVATCALLQICLSFAPHKALRHLFPPVVSGCTVILIGVALVGTGFSYWGGGNYCSSQVLTSKVPCNTNGDVVLPFGSRQYVGLGFVVFFTLIITEMFGSPFLRNIGVVVGLFVGMVVASSVYYIKIIPNCVSPTCPCYEILPGGLTYDNTTNSVVGSATGTNFVNTTVCETSCGDPVCSSPSYLNQRYVTSAAINQAPWITFLWVHTFKLGFYAPAVLPILFGFMVTTMECIGDITATTEASELIPIGDDFERSIQGGVLADGLACIYGALGTMLPPVTYAQNNGVISLTRCAARRAGWMCGILLIILGVISKFAGVILSIPDCVLGGMTTFLFINVTVSGIRILTMAEGITRRNRFIASLSLGLGIGVELLPAFFNISGQSGYPNQGNFWPIDESWTTGYRGFRDAIVIVLTNGFSVGGFTALIANLIIPHDAAELNEPPSYTGPHKLDGEKLPEEMEMTRDV